MREKGREERGPKKPSKNSDFGTPLIWVLFSGRPTENLKYVMHFFYLKYSGTPNIGICYVILSQSVLPNKQQKLPKIFGLSTIKEYVTHIFFCMKYSQEYFRY